MVERIFKRGEIYWVNIGKEPNYKKDFKSKPKGTEIQKDRPGVIVSNNI